MSLSLAQFAANIQQAINAISGPEIERQVARAGADLTALISTRVIQRGQDSKGQLFTPYSNTPVPAWFYIGKSRTGSADAQVRQKAKQRERLSYADFRKLNNLKTDKKNFEFTGAMWRGFGVTKIERSAGRVRVVLDGRNRDSADKIEWLSEQEKQQITEPSAAELQQIKRNLEAWLISIINGRG